MTPTPSRTRTARLRMLNNALKMEPLPVWQRL
jgi:hypothetical protein